MKKNCPACNADAFALLITYRDNYFFGYCQKCGLNYITPMPDTLELKRIYKKFIQSYPNSVIAAEHSDFSDFAKDRYNFITSRNDIAAPKRLLEIGSSYGLFLNEFKHTTWEVHGIEPSKGPADYSKSEFGLKNIQTCMLDKATLAPGSFDIICSFHVIEHSSDPLSMLKTMRHLIKENGRLFISTPNLSVLTPNIIQYHFLYHGLHLVLFTPKTMSSILNRAGFKLIDCQPEKDRPSETGSMIIEAKPGEIFEKDSPEEIQHARIYGKKLEGMRNHLKNAFQKWFDAGLNVAIYGGGIHTQGLLDCIGDVKSCIVIIFDDDPLKFGKAINGIPIRTFNHKDLDEVDIIVVSSLVAEERILEKIKRTTDNSVRCYGIYRDILHH